MRSPLTTAPSAPPPARSTEGGPLRPTAAEIQESSYTRDPARRAELHAKINAWQQTEQAYRYSK